MRLPLLARLLPTFCIGVTLCGASHPVAAATHTPPAIPSASYFAGLQTSWRASTETDLSVVPNSALDFSSVLVGNDMRMHCASFVFSGPSGYPPSHDATATLVQQLKIQGYNLVRLGALDYSMIYDRAYYPWNTASLPYDLGWDSGRVDDAFYFIAGLSSNGIRYWSDVLDGPSGGKGNMVWNNTLGWVDKTTLRPYNLQLLANYDSATQLYLENMIDSFWARANPYLGGISTVQDPKMLWLSLNNEGGLYRQATLNNQNFDAFKDSKGVPLLQTPFNAWLRKTYTNDAGLKLEWGAELGTAESLAAGSVLLPSGPATFSANRNDTGWAVYKRRRDFARFVAEAESGMVSQLGAFLKNRGLGATSYFAALDADADLVSMAVRSQMPLVDSHTYHDHPNWSPSNGVLAEATQNSVFDSWQVSNGQNVFDQSLKYFTDAAGMRVANLPFVAAEFGHVYPNKYRRELPIFSALGSLQGWNGMCQYGSNLSEFKTAPPHLIAPHISVDTFDTILPFQTWGDPIAHAADRIQALLFRRGDVSAAHKTIGLIQREHEALYNSEMPWWKSWSLRTPTNAIDDLRKLALVTGLTNVRESDVDANGNWIGSGKAPDALLDPLRGPKTVPDSTHYSALYKPLANTTPVRDPQFSERVQQLIDSGFLPLGKNNPAKSVVQSDTGEITIDFPNHSASIVTPRSEVLIFDQTPVSGNAVTVVGSTASTTLAVHSLDGAPLAASKRLLLIHLTDAQATGLAFGDAAHTQVTQWGKWPAKIRGGAVGLKLGIPAGTWTLWALDLQGNRVATVAADWNDSDGKFQLVLDNTARSSPTLYYELVNAAYVSGH